MKQLKQFMIFLIIGISIQVHAQTKSANGFGLEDFLDSGLKLKSVSLYSGSSSPLGEFQDFSKTGLDFGLSLDLGITDLWGWGLDYNRQINGPQVSNERFNFPESGPNYNITTNLSRQNWVASTFGFGPWWMIQPEGPGGNSIEVYSKAGVSFVKSPTANTVLTYNGNSGSLFELQQQSKTAFGLTAGVRFKRRINENMSVFLNPQYVYTSTKFDYTFKDLTYAYVTGPFNPQLALYDIRPQTAQINPNYFNVNLGVSFNLGQDERQKDKEQKIVLKYPESNATYSESKPYKKFKWDHVGRQRGDTYNYKIVVTSLSKEAKVYTAFSNKPEIALKDVFKGDEVKGKYRWNVTEVISGLKAAPFVLKSASSGLDVQILNITCQDPAYTQDGNVCYTAEVVFENSPNNNMGVFVHSDLTMHDPLGVNSPTNATLVTCPGELPIAFPLSLAPGASVTACIEFCRPIGETTTYVQANYHRPDAPNATMNEISVDTLPNCACNICDGWKIQLKEKQVTQLNNTWGNMSINQTIQISGADPMQKVSAQIVYVHHDVNDPQCYTCTKEDDHMGLFVDRGNSGNITTSPSNWQNEGQGSLSDEDADDYGNQFTWCANSPEGVDLYTPTNFKMTINMPEVSNLSCCTSTYQVCIRYTFTDINCRTCTQVKCYSIDTTNNENNETSDQQQDPTKK